MVQLGRELIKREICRRNELKHLDREQRIQLLIDDDELGVETNTYPVIVKQTPIDNALNLIAEYLGASDKLTPEIKREITEQLRTSSMKFEVMLNLMAVRRAERVAKLFGYQDTLESMMMDPERLADAETLDLVRIYKVIRESVQQSIEQMQNIVIRGEPIIPKFLKDIQQSNIDVESQNLTAKESNKIRELISGFLTAANSNG